MKKESITSGMETKIMNSEKNRDCEIQKGYYMVTPTKKWPIVLMTVISCVDILIIILLFTFFIAENEFNIGGFIVLLIPLLFLMILSVFFYVISIKEEKLKLLEEFFIKERLTPILGEKTITKKNENPLNPAIVTETVDSTTFNSKAKVLISAIEAIKDL